MLYIELVWNVEHELWYGNQEMLSLHRSKELTELIMRMEHQLPHLLDTMEQVISLLHADWQQLKRDRDNLHNKLKRLE